jgi:hypothetical protein
MQHAAGFWLTKKVGKQKLNNEDEDYETTLHQRPEPYGYLCMETGPSGYDNSKRLSRGRRFSEGK